MRQTRGRLNRNELRFVNSVFTICFSTVPAQEMSHTLQCNFDLLITGGITRADKSFSAAAKCAAGNDSNPFLMQQTLAELLIGHSGNGDTRKSIKRAARLEALQAKLVEAADQQ